MTDTISATVDFLILFRFCSATDIELMLKALITTGFLLQWFVPSFKKRWGWTSATCHLENYLVLEQEQLVTVLLDDTSHCAGLNRCQQKDVTKDVRKNTFSIQHVTAFQTNTNVKQFRNILQSTFAIEPMMLIEVHELPHIIIFNDLFKLWSTVIHTNTCQHAFLWSECLRCFNNSSLNRFTTVQCRVGGFFFSRALFLLFSKTRECLVFMPKEVSTLCYDEFTVPSEISCYSMLVCSIISTGSFVRLNKYLFWNCCYWSCSENICEVDWFHKMEKVSISVCFIENSAVSSLSAVVVGGTVVWQCFASENTFRTGKHWNITKRSGCIKIWRPPASRSIK